MAILCDWEIRARCEQGLIAPFDEALINPASLDVRLGRHLRIESVESPELILIDMERMGCSSLDPFLLRPGQFVLAETLETLALGTDVAGQFMLKSSRAREGIEHLLAGYMDPGYCGKPTLELHNSRQLHSVGLWPGMRIGQLVLHRMSQPPLRDYSMTGRYQGDSRVQGSKG